MQQGHVEIKEFQTELLKKKSVSNPISSQNWTEADCLGKSRAHLPSNRLYRPIPRNPPIPRPSSPPEEMPADRKGRHFWVDSSHIEDKKSDVWVYLKGKYTLFDMLAHMIVRNELFSVV